MATTASYRTFLHSVTHVRRLPEPALDCTLAALRLENQQLQEALTSRATIDQAKGMIMAVEGCDADAAFAVLQRVSTDTNVKLRDLAATMVYHARVGEDPFVGVKHYLTASA